MKSKENALTDAHARDRIKANQRRLLCPACKRKTLTFLLPESECKEFPMKCDRCGVVSILNISPEPEPDF